MTPLRSSEEAALTQGLELLRDRERLHISKKLHDEIGPTLCAVGLHLGLLKSSLQHAPESLETLASIESALDEAVRSVRSLSYTAAPDLAARCGLRAALQYLSQDLPLSLDLSQETEGVHPRQSGALFRIVLGVALEASQEGPGDPVHVSTQADGVALLVPRTAAGRLLPSDSTIETLRGLTAHLSICMERHRQSGEAGVLLVARVQRL